MKLLNYDFEQSGEKSKNALEMTLTATMVLIVMFTILMFVIGGIGLKTNPETYYFLPIFFSCCTRFIVVVMSSVFISIYSTMESTNIENKENMDLQDECFDFGFTAGRNDIFRSESVASEANEVS